MSGAFAVASFLVGKLFGDEEEEKFKPREAIRRSKRIVTSSAEPVREVIGSARVSGQLCRYATYVDRRNARAWYNANLPRIGQQAAYDGAHLHMERNVLMLIAICEGPVQSLNEHRIWVNGRKVLLVKDEITPTSGVLGRWLPAEVNPGEWDSPRDPNAYPFFWARGAQTLTEGYEEGDPLEYNPSCSFYFAYPRGRTETEPLIATARDDFDTSEWEGANEEEKERIRQDAKNILGSGLALCYAKFKMLRDVHGNVAPWNSMPNIEFEVTMDKPHHNPSRAGLHYLTNYLGVREEDIDTENNLALTIPEQLFPLGNLTEGSEAADQVVGRTLGRRVERNADGSLVTGPDKVTEEQYERVLASYNRIYPTELKATTDQQRYACAGVITTNDNPAQVLDGLGRAMAGRIFRYLGKWYIRPGYERIPVGVIRAHHVLNEQVSIQLEPDFDTRPNAVTARMAQNKRREYLRSSIPEIEFPDLITRDAGKIPRDFGELPYVNDGILARKIMTIQVNQASKGLSTVSLTCGPGENFWIYQLKPMDVVLLDIPMEGYRIFQNEETRFVVESISPGDDGSVQLVLNEEFGSTYIERTGIIVARDDTPPRFGLIEDDDDDDLDLKCSAPNWNISVPSRYNANESPRVTATGNSGDPLFSIVDNGGFSQLRIDATTGKLSFEGYLTNQAIGATISGISVRYTVQVEDQVNGKTSSCTGTINFFDVRTPNITGPSDGCVSAGRTDTYSFGIEYPADASDDFIRRHQYSFIINRYAPQVGTVPPSWITISSEGLLTVAVPSGTANATHRVNIQAVRRDAGGRLATGSGGRVETSDATRLYTSFDLQVGNCATCTAKDVSVIRGTGFTTTNAIDVSQIGNSPNVVLGTGSPSWLRVSTTGNTVTLSANIPLSVDIGRYPYTVTATQGANTCTVGGTIHVIRQPIQPPKCKLPAPTIGGNQITIDTSSNKTWDITPTGPPAGILPQANILSSRASWLELETTGSQIRLKTKSGVVRKVGEYAYTIGFRYPSADLGENSRLTCSGLIRVRASRTPLTWDNVPSSVTVTKGRGWGENIHLSASTDSSCQPIRYAVTSKPHSSLRVHSTSGSLAGTVPTSLPNGELEGTFTATDQCGRTITKTITFNVEGASLTCAVDSLYGALGASVFGNTSIVRGKAPYSYSLVSKPAWLSINTSTGRLSGTLPNTRQSGTFTVQVTDANRQSSTCTGSWGAAGQPLSCSVAKLEGRANSTISGQVNVAGGSGSYTRYVLSGNPSWIRIDQSTGSFSGIYASQGSGTFTVTVTDSAGASTSCTVEYEVLRIVVPPTCPAPIEIDLQAGHSFSRNIAILGTGIRYALVGNPSWVSIDDSASELIQNAVVVRGTAPSTFNADVSFRVRGTSTNGTSCDTTFTLKFQVPPLRHATSPALYWIRKTTYKVSTGLTRRRAASLIQLVRRTDSQ